MSKLRSTPFQNCTKNVINDGGADTLGNILCEKMARFYRRQPPLGGFQLLVLIITELKSHMTY